MTRGKQMMLALLSLLALALLVMGVIWGQRFLLSVSPKNDHTAFKIQRKNSQGISSIEVAEKAVLLLEEKQSQEALSVAKEAVNKLAKNKEKSSLLARLTVVEAKLQNKEVEAEAERAVVYLEGHPDLSNISLAQELILKVTNPDVKKALEERVRLVQETLSLQNSSPNTSVVVSHYDTSQGTFTEGAYITETVPVTPSSAPVSSSVQVEQAQPVSPVTDMENPTSSESIGFEDVASSSAETTASVAP